MDNFSRTIGFWFEYARLGIDTDTELLSGMLLFAFAISPRNLSRRKNIPPSDSSVGHIHRVEYEGITKKILKIKTLGKSKTGRPRNNWKQQIYKRKWRNKRGMRRSQTNRIGNYGKRRKKKLNKYNCKRIYYRIQD